MAKPKGVLFYPDDVRAAEQLTLEEFGSLIQATLHYAETGEVGEMVGNARFLFPSFKARVDRDFERYQDTCKRNSLNARKRWEADTTGISGIPDDTTGCDRMRGHATACEGMPSDATACDRMRNMPIKRKEQEQRKVQVQIQKDIKVAAATHPQYDYEYFQQTYNGTCSKLPACQVMSEKRREAIRKFSKDFTPAQWADICSKANRSGFLTGQNDRGWRADIDFLLRPDKAARIIEGGYVEETKPSKPKAPVDDGMDKYLNF